MKYPDRRQETYVVAESQGNRKEEQPSGGKGDSYMKREKKGQGNNEEERSATLPRYE